MPEFGGAARKRRLHGQSLARRLIEAEFDADVGGAEPCVMGWLRAAGANGVGRGLYDDGETRRQSVFDIAGEFELTVGRNGQGAPLAVEIAVRVREREFGDDLPGARRLEKRARMRRMRRQGRAAKADNERIHHATRAQTRVIGHLDRTPTRKFRESAGVAQAEHFDWCGKRYR